jgi:hypothetical protein
MPLRASNEVARQGFISAADRAKQLDCLTRNIYWESATEPFEGKVAVAQVTINRVESGRFASDICGVVYQKNVVYDKVICQFSWFCDGSSKVKAHISSTLERKRRSGQKSPVRRIPFAQREERLVLSRGLCQTPMGQTTGSQIWETHFLCGQNMIIKLDELLNSARTWLDQHWPKVSAETLGWLAVVVIHCATIPTLLALLTGLSDTVPNLDIVLFMWTGLVLLFARAVVLKDMLNIVTIGMGFTIQAVIMAMILFK